jgi:hypothetical protein
VTVIASIRESPLGSGLGRCISKLAGVIGLNLNRAVGNIVTRLREIWKFFNQPLMAGIVVALAVPAIFHIVSRIKSPVGEYARSLITLRAEPPWPFVLGLVIWVLIVVSIFQWRTIRSTRRGSEKKSGRPRLEFAGLGWEALRTVLRMPAGDPRANAVTGPLCPNCWLNLSDLQPPEIRPPVKKGDTYRYTCPSCKKLVGNIDAVEFCANPDVGPYTLPLDIEKLKVRVFEEARARQRRIDTGTM